MLKHIVLAAFLTCGAAAAYAQPQQATSPPPSVTGPANTTMAPSATADTRKLIGRNIKNADGDTIGEIKSIYINKDGKVDSVMQNLVFIYSVVFVMLNILVDVAIALLDPRIRLR